MTEKKCAHCSKVLVGQIPAQSQEDIPKEGDVLLCPYCYKLNVYDNQMELIVPSDEYLNSMPDWFSAEIDKHIERLKSRR